MMVGFLRVAGLVVVIALWGYTGRAFAVRVAGVGANSGNQAANQIFSSGDLPGSIARINEATFNAMSVSALRAAYDVIIITWSSDPSLNVDWATRLLPYLSLGGGVIYEDPNNTGDLAAVITASGCGSGGFNISATVPGLTDGINNSFVNCHFGVSAWDAALNPFIKNGATQVIGLFGQFSGGRIVITGPDQDFHAVRGAGGAAGNQYNLLLNEVRFVSGGGGCAAHEHGHVDTANPGHFTGVASPHAHHAQHGHNLVAPTTCPPHAFGHTAGLTGESGEGFFGAASQMAEPDFVVAVNQDGASAPLRRGAAVTLYGVARALFLDAQDRQSAIDFTPPVSGQPLYYTTVIPEVRVGGVPAKVLFSGLAPGLKGVWQINLIVPDEVASGNAPVEITYEDAKLTSVSLAIE